MSTIQGRNYQISARVIGKMSVGELIAKMCTIKGHHTQQDIWSLPARSQTPRPLPGKIKPWTYFTSDSDHLLHIHTAAQPAENERTVSDERAPALAIFARPNTHQMDQGSCAAFPRTRPDPANSRRNRRTAG